MRLKVTNGKTLVAYKDEGHTLRKMEEVGVSVLS